MYWLIQDWIDLHSTLPIPAGNNGGRSSNVRAYGHPAEWASDKTRQIADLFWSWHDLEAERRDETRPKPIVDSTGRRSRTEQQVIVAAWRYLEPRIDDMLAAHSPFDQLRVPYAWDWAIDDEAFTELFDVHREIRAGTGRTRPRYTLPIPCPNSDCGLRTLQRIAGIGQDFIVCDACGYSIKDQHYPLLIRMTLDTLIGAAA
jgi:hypothetical protein